MAAIEVNGTTLEVVEKGAGMPVVFLHGAYADWRCWQAQLDPFAEKYRAIAYSQRFHHPNPALPEGGDNPLEPQIEDLALLLDALSIDRAHIIGSSQGGLIATYFARRYTERVDKLVLAEPAVMSLLASVQPKRGEILKLLLSSPLAGMSFLEAGTTGIGPATKAYQAGDFERGMELFVTMGIGKDYAARLTQDRREQARINARPHAAFLLGEQPAPLTRDDLRAIEAPALLLNATDSSRHMQLVARMMAKLMPNAELNHVSNASHLMNEDNPESFNTTVLEFLGR